MNNKNKGIICILISALFFVAMNIFVRLSGELPVMQKSFFRNFFAMLIAGVILFRSGWETKIEGGKLNKKDIIFLILRSSFGTVGILCNFYAVDHLVVADATILNKMSPFFAIIFSYLILKERTNLFQSLCVVVAFIGTVFVVKPGFSDVSPIPAMIGFLGGMGAGTAYTMVRILGGRKVKGPFIVFFFSAFSCLVTVPYMIFNYHPMTMQQLAALILAGISAAAAQFAITAAYRYCPAKEISIYEYTQVIFITLMGFLFLNEIPDYLSFIGYIIICGASVVMYLYQRKNA